MFSEPAGTKQHIMGRSDQIAMRHFLHRGHDSRGKQHETPEKSNPKAKRSIRDHFKAKISPRRHDTRDTAEGTVTETSSCREENHDDGPSRLESSSPCVEVSVTSPPTLRESTQTLEELVMRDLWKIALERLQGNEGHLLAAYGQDLVRGCNNDENTEGRPEEDQSNQVKMQQQQQLVYEALRQLEDGQLFIPRRCRQNAIGDHVQRIIQTILSVKDVISQAISAEPHAALAWAGILVVLPLLLKPFTQIEEAAKGIEFIAKLLIRYQVVQTSHIQVFIEGPGKSERLTSNDRFCSSIREQTIELYTQILEYQIRLARQFTHSGFFRTIRDLVTADDWLGMTNNIKKIDDSIHTMLAEWSQKTIKHIDETVGLLQEKMDQSLSLAISIKQDINTQHNKNLLESITCVTGATYGSYDQDKRICLEGTQVGVLEKIQKWSLGDEEKPILWLQGMAGTGKSTIARTAAAAFRNGTSLTKDDALPDEICLGGSFFFDHKKKDCRDPRNVFPTLARQLAGVIPEIQNSVCAAIANHHDIQQRTLRDQWRYLIWEPLSMLQSDLRDTVMVVIDALDECEVQTNSHQDDLELLLELLSQVHHLRSVRMRILITSRPEADMQRHIKSLSQDIHHQTLEKIKLINDTDDREDDITCLVKHEMIAIKRSHPKLAIDWPGTEALRQLVVQAEGLFIYATTVCRFLRDATERTIQLRLQKILDYQFDGSSKGNNLNEMYTRILEIILTGEADNDEETINSFQQVVGCIIALSQPLSLIDLDGLIPCEIDDIKWILGQLRSVIEVPQDAHKPIQLVHLSFRDFLLDPARCKNDLFSLDEKNVNHVVFERCLDLMSCYLHRDICRLRDPGIEACNIDLESPEIERFFPGSLRYACGYWAEHLERGGDVSSADEARILGFLETHFTHWLEAMCLMGMMPHAIKTLDVLTAINMSQEIGKFLFDAKKFTTNFKLHIEKMPLQIYTSSLPCAPRNSIIRKTFKKEIPAWITQLPVIQNEWGAFSHHIRLSQSIFSLDFSSDNKLLLVMCLQEARLYETATWRCVLEIHEGEFDRGFRQIVLSPDNTRLAAFFQHGTAHLWYVCDGRFIDIEVYSQRIVGIEFSRSGNELFCLLSDNKMLIANGKTGDILATLSLRVRAAPVRCVESRWDQSQLMYFNLVSSKDSRFIAIVDDEYKINVFDQNQGSIIHSYGHDPGHGDCRTIRSLAFSHDGKLLLSASNNGHVKVWDSETKILYEVETGDELLEANFSADFTAVTIVYGDLRISKWIWSTEKFEKQMDHLGPKFSVHGECRVSFPQSGPLVTCLMSDGHGGIWKNIQSTCAQIQDRSYGGNDAIAFSPNGKFIASVGDQGTDVSIWEVPAHSMQSQDAEQDNYIQSVELSPDGNWVASFHSNSSTFSQVVKLWNGNGELKENWRIAPDIDDHWIRTMFSADSKVFLIGSYRGKIQSWDLVIGKPLNGIDFSNPASTKLITFTLSLDQNLLALAWMDVIEEMGETQYPYRVTLWDLAKNKALCEFEPESKSDFLAGLKQVAISPNNATIALSSICRIYLYDSAGNILYSLGHGEDAAVLAFSANGELLASGNQTVSIWETATGQKMKEIQVQALVNEISFTDEDRFILTSEGRFSTASIMANDEDAYGTGLFCRDLYIMNGRNRVLALSPEFLGPEPPLPRGGFASVRGGKVAMVSPPNRVGIFGLNTDVDHIL